MGWFGFGASSSGDESKMKVTDTPDTLKVERISSESHPHTHDIVKVDKDKGTVVEIRKGENVETRSSRRSK